MSFRGHERPKALHVGTGLFRFYNFAKARSTGANIKTLKFDSKYVYVLIESNLLVPVMDHNFHGMMILCQKHS